MSGSWASLNLPPHNFFGSSLAFARFVDAHEACAERTTAQRVQWEKDAEAMKLQISAMEETLVLLEREVKHATASLAKVEAAEKRGGIGSGSSAADLELLLGQLEDKVSGQLSILRPLVYAPDSLCPT